MQCTSVQKAREEACWKGGQQRGSSIQEEEEKGGEARLVTHGEPLKGYESQQEWGERGPKWDRREPHNGEGTNTIRMAIGDQERQRRQR